MHLKILADECLDFRIVKELKDKGFPVISVLKEYQGTPDVRVLELAREHNAILITEDSDFGEWVFAHKVKDISVIYLRYKSSEIEEIKSSLLRQLHKHGSALYGRFVTITPKKVRIRGIL
ncbi:MAG: DUF5615 family PIN-like protein [Nitrospirae bacterium]|nr:DUF5615 family PIN-like protein [Nitrospirota bacterium]